MLAGELCKCLTSSSSEIFPLRRSSRKMPSIRLSCDIAGEITSLYQLRRGSPSRPKTYTFNHCSERIFRFQSFLLDNLQNVLLKSVISSNVEASAEDSMNRPRTFIRPNVTLIAVCTLLC